MPNIKVTWLLPGTTQHLLDVSQCIALREVIGMALPEHVSHSTAGNDLQAATAHPHSERELWKRPQESHSCRQIGSISKKGNFSRVPENLAPLLWMYCLQQQTQEKQFHGEHGRTVLPLLKWRQPSWLRDFLAFSSSTPLFGPLSISVRHPSLQPGPRGCCQAFRMAFGNRLGSPPTPTLFWTSVTLQPCTWMEEKKKKRIHGVKQIM